MLQFLYVSSMEYPDSFSYAANDSSKCICICAKTNGKTNCIFKASAHADNLQCYRNRTLASLIKSV